MSTTLPATDTTDGVPSVPQVIDEIWVFVSSQVNSGAIENIKLPLAFKSIIGQQGIDVIANRFKKLINKPVSTCEDANSEIIHLIPTEVLFKKSGATSKHGHVPVGKKAKVPRPPNAFILYRQKHHPIIREKYPDLHNNQISVILGTQWKSETDEVKKKFQSMAESIKKHHSLVHPDYSYQPRKPTERKRRMTQKKAATLTKLSHKMFNKGLEVTVPDLISSVDTAVSNFSQPMFNKGLEATLPDFSGAMDTAKPIMVNPITPIMTYGMGTDDPEDMFNPLPDLELTKNRDPVINLGDMDLSDRDLAQLLNNYVAQNPLPTVTNQAFVLAPLQPISAQNQLPPGPAPLPPIFDMEPSDEAAYDAGFYSGIIDWDNVHEQHEQAIEQFEDGLAKDELSFKSFDQATFEEHLGQWDEIFPSYKDAEVNRFAFEHEDF